MRRAALLVLLFALAARAADPAPPARFDLTVREDIFAGFAGDKEALATGVKKCDDALKANPKNAEALVWRGAARVFQSSQSFQANKPLEGVRLWSTGLKDMDDAVALEPDNPGVRIPRASVLMPAAHNAPAAMAKPLIPKALEDFRAIERLQKEHLGRIGTHPLGELRMGLADAYRLAGKLDESRAQLEKVRAELPDTKYAKRATDWLAAKPTAKLQHNCIGCHTKAE